MSHYYTNEPHDPKHLYHYVFEYRGMEININSADGIFSKAHLDLGTKLLLDNLPKLTGNVRDLGCGSGVIACALGKTQPELQIDATDVNELALKFTQINVLSNELDNVKAFAEDGVKTGSYDAVITNPPIRVGKAIVYRMFEEARHALKPQGQLFLVVRKKQGASSAIKHLETLFTTVEVIASRKGFVIIKCIK